MLALIALVTPLSLSGTSPLEWREFRARLAGSSVGRGSTSNEAALKQIDEKLWQEYSQGVWAHGTSLVEPGVLLCALPIQGQLIQELRLSNGRTVSSTWPDALLSQLLDDDSSGLMERWLGPSADPDPIALAFAWKSATTLCNAGLSKMCSGIPSHAERLLWKEQCAALERRGRVLLVLGEEAEEEVMDAGAEGGTSGPSYLDCLVQNKQIASELTPDLARRLLVGERETWQADGDDVAMLMKAFGASPVYFGGPEELSGCGRIVHGQDGLCDRQLLPSSREIASGTRIYASTGADAILEAARAVVEEQAQPVDFRLSLGRTRLSLKQAQVEWMPVACSRLLALKPTGAGLPTPLWREVMEACGSEPAEISRLVREESDGGSKPRNPNRPRGDSDI